MTFARFMELALYHPTFGYYTGGGAGEDKVGWEGDFYTSSDVHSAFGQALARQLRQMDELLHQPDPFTVIEMGPGKGLLARDILHAAAGAESSLLDRWRYVLLERSPAMRAAQRSTLGSSLAEAGRVTWVESLAELDHERIVGVMLSNELVDAFPVHRVTRHHGELREIVVDVEGDRFRERLAPLSTPELARYFERLGLTLEEGQIAEVNLEALGWMRSVGRILRQGFVITIDYGHVAEDLYDAVRRRGTLLCYHRHRVVDDPYERVGLQDMTAHVDFTSLAMTGEDAGLTTTGFTNHMGFLTGLGIEEVLQQLDPGSREFESVVQLLRPDGMGRTFKILIQHKGVEHPKVDGLTFKPFFDAALTPRHSGATGSREAALGQHSDTGAAAKGRAGDCTTSH